MVSLLVLSSYFGPEIRSCLSYIVKHTPLCWVENAGFIKPKRAHYSEELGITINVLKCTPLQAPRLVGNALQNELIVIFDLGAVVQRFDRFGKLIWQREFKMPRGIEMVNRRVFVGAGRSLGILEAGMSTDIDQITHDQYISNLKYFKNKHYLLFNMSVEGGLKGCQLIGGKLVLQQSSKVITEYLRALHVNGDGVFVADIFGQRIIRMNSETLEISDQMKSYYQNKIDAVGDRL